MMDPQQIREALYHTSEDTTVIIAMQVVIVDAAAEYADLLEASERIWWCERIHRSTQLRAQADGRCAKCGGADSGCGWRLLTPTERTT